MANFRCILLYLTVTTVERGQRPLQFGNLQPLFTNLQGKVKVISVGGGPQIQQAL